MKSLSRKSFAPIALAVCVVAALSTFPACQSATKVADDTAILSHFFPNDQVDSMYLGSAEHFVGITAPIDADGKTLIMDVDWTTSDPTVVSLVGPTTTNPNSLGVRYVGLKEGDAILTGTPHDPIKTLTGQPVVYRRRVSVAALPNKLKINTPTPYQLQLEGATANPSASFKTTALVLAPSGRGIRTDVVWTSLDPTVITLNDLARVPESRSRANNDPIEVIGVGQGLGRLVASLVQYQGLPKLADTILVIVGGGTAIVSSSATNEMEVGETRNFTVAVKDATGATVSNPVVQWSTSRPSVATIDQTGKVTALAASADGDTASVLASVPSLGIVGRLQFTVLRKVASIAIIPNPITVAQGAFAEIRAHFLDAQGNIIRRYRSTADWNITPTFTVATVEFPRQAPPAPDTIRTMKGQAAGTATLAVSYPGVTTATAPITVTPVANTIALFVALAGGGSRAVSPTGEALAIGATLQLIATAKDANGATISEPVTFTTASPSIASVTASGTNSANIGGVSAGAATITATSSSNSNVKATANIIVGSAQIGGTATRIVMTANPASGVTSVGGTVQYSAVAKDANGLTASDCPVGLAVDFTDVGALSGNTVTGVGAGSSPVRAFCTDQRVLSAASRFTVLDAQFGVTQVNVSPQFIHLNPGQSFQFAASVVQTSSGPIAPVKWDIASSGGATISATGLVSVSPSATAGGAIITASAVNQYDLAWVTFGNAGSIKGAVSSTSGQYLAGLTATATPPGSGTPYQTTINNNNTFYFAGLPPGTYTVSVRQQGNPTAQTITNVTVVATQTTLLTLAPFP